MRGYGAGRLRGERAGLPDTADADGYATGTHSDDDLAAGLTVHDSRGTQWRCRALHGWLGTVRLSSGSDIVMTGRMDVTMKRGDTTTMTSGLYLTQPRDRVTAERLYLEFHAVLPLSVVYRTVAAAEHDLQGQIVPEAWDEMVYRLAQYRLGQLVTEDAN